MNPLPLDPTLTGAIAGVMVSVAAAIPALMLKARAMAPANPDRAMEAMALGVKAMAAALVIRFGFALTGLYGAVKAGLSGPGFAVGFFAVYFTVQLLETRWLYTLAPAQKGDAT